MHPVGLILVFLPKAFVEIMYVINNKREPTSVCFLFLYWLNSVVHQSARNYKHRWVTVKSKTEKELKRLRLYHIRPSNTTVDNMKYRAHHEEVLFKPQ